MFFQHLSETIGAHPGDGELFINGLHIDLDIHNPFRWDSSRGHKALPRKAQINASSLLPNNDLAWRIATLTLYWNETSVAVFL